MQACQFSSEKPIKDIPDVSLLFSSLFFSLCILLSKKAYLSLPGELDLPKREQCYQPLRTLTLNFFFCLSCTGSEKTLFSESLKIHVLKLYCFQTGFGVFSRNIPGKNQFLWHVVAKASDTSFRDKPSQIQNANENSASMCPAVWGKVMKIVIKTAVSFLFLNCYFNGKQDWARHSSKFDEWPVLFADSFFQDLLCLMTYICLNSATLRTKKHDLPQI